MMFFEGKVHLFGDSISADHIISAKYIDKVNSLREMLPYLFEEIQPDFMDKFKTGDIIVAGENFGAGSSREHAPLLFKEAGVSCIIAKSFGRNFFRNAINLGIPLAEVDWEGLREGQDLKVFFSDGYMENPCDGKKFTFASLPPIMEKILLAGGLIPYFKKNKTLQLT